MNQIDVIKKMVEKSWASAEFKAEFIANPVAVIEKELGRKIDLKGKQLVVMDQSDKDSYYLNLSRNIQKFSVSDRELTDEQLEAVAGGAHSQEDYCPYKPDLPGKPGDCFPIEEYDF